MKPAALLCGITFALGCYFASQTEHIGAIEAASWLPLCWLGTLDLCEGWKRRGFLALGGGVALSLFSRFTPTVLVSTFSIGALGIALVAMRRASRGLLIRLAAAGFWGCCLVSIQLIPAIELAARSVGRYRSDWLGTGGGIPAAAFISLVWPDYFHIFNLAAYKSPYELTLLYLYCGFFGLLACLVALIRFRGAVKWILAGMLCLSIFGMLGDGTAIGKAFFLLLPRFVRISYYPQCWMAVFSLCVALLAGFGTQAVRWDSRWIYVVCVAAATDLILVGSGRPMNAARGASLVTHSVFEGDAGVLPAVRPLSHNATPPCRIDTAGDSDAWSLSAPVTGIPSANSYDPLALVRFIQARLALARGERWGAYYEVQNIDAPMLDFLNFCLVSSRTPLRPDALAGADLRLIYKGARSVYENDSSLPRFFFVPHVRKVQSMNEAAELVRRRSWRPAEQAVVEGVPLVQDTEMATGEVQVLSYGPNVVRLQTNSAGKSFLVSSEVNYPGWTARIDGHDTPIYYTNVAFRGLLLPPGAHDVEFRFRPQIFFSSGIVSVLAILGGLLTLWRAIARARNLPSQLSAADPAAVDPARG